MTIAIPPALEAPLEALARAQGRDVQSVIVDALARLAGVPVEGANGHAPQAAHDLPLRGTVIRYDDPTEPAIPDDGWESSR